MAIHRQGIRKATAPLSVRSHLFDMLQNWDWFLARYEPPARTSNSLSSEPAPCSPPPRGRIVISHLRGLPSTTAQQSVGFNRCQRAAA